MLMPKYKGELSPYTHAFKIHITNSFISLYMYHTRIIFLGNSVVKLVSLTSLTNSPIQLLNGCKDLKSGTLFEFCSQSNLNLGQDESHLWDPFKGVNDLIDCKQTSATETNSGLFCTRK